MPQGSYRNDPYWITARFPGIDAGNNIVAASAYAEPLSARQARDATIDFLRFFEAISTKPVIQVALDGSWAKPKAPGGIGAYAGVAAPSASWTRFVEEWQAELAGTGLSYFRTTEAMNWCGQFKAKYQEWGDSRELQREQFVLKLISVIRRNEFRVVGAASQIERFSEKARVQRKLKLFHLVIRDLLRQCPPGFPVSFICDQEQDLSSDCMRWLHKFQDLYPDTRNQIAGLCYMKTEHVVPLQASDLVAYLMRQDAQRDIDGLERRNSLYAALIDPHGQRSMWIPEFRIFDALQDPL